MTVTSVVKIAMINVLSLYQTKTKLLSYFSNTGILSELMQEKNLIQKKNRIPDKAYLSWSVNSA